MEIRGLKKENVTVVFMVDKRRGFMSFIFLKMLASLFLEKEIWLFTEMIPKATSRFIKKETGVGIHPTCIDLWRQDPIISWCILFSVFSK